MSDTFDHEADAWDDFINRGDDIDIAYNTGRSSIDHNFYHSDVDFKEVVARTSKAYLLGGLRWNDRNLGQCWVPASLCRYFNEEEGEAMIYTPFLKSIVMRQEMQR